LPPQSNFGQQVQTGERVLDQQGRSHRIIVLEVFHRSQTILQLIKRRWNEALLARLGSTDPICERQNSPM
jgi:hypothetical protein